MSVNTSPAKAQDVETFIASYHELVDAGYYLRSNEPIVRLWAAGGDDLLQRLYNEFLSAYESKPDDKSKLVLAVNLSDFLPLPAWRAAVERAKADLPGHPFTEMIEAFLLARTGETDAAKPHMELALEMDAGNPDIIAMAASMFAIDWKQPERAMELIDRAMWMAPDIAGYHVVRGDIYGVACGDHASALKEFDRAVQLSPDHYPFRNMRALSHINLGDHTAAITDLEAVLKAYPDSPNGRFTLLKSYLATGNMRGAAGTLLAPRKQLYESGRLEADHPVKVSLLPGKTYSFTLPAVADEQVTVHAEGDDPKFVAPFIALIDPNGDLIAHSVIYTKPMDMPEAGVILSQVLAVPGNYTVVVCHNLSTWQSLGEGELRISMTRNR